MKILPLKNSARLYASFDHHEIDEALMGKYGLGDPEIGNCKKDIDMAESLNDYFDKKGTVLREGIGTMIYAVDNALVFFKHTEYEHHSEQNIAIRVYSEDDTRELVKKLKGALPKLSEHRVSREYLGDSKKEGVDYVSKLMRMNGHMTPGDKPLTQENAKALLDSINLALKD